MVGTCRNTQDTLNSRVVQAFACKTTLNCDTSNTHKWYRGTCDRKDSLMCNGLHVPHMSNMLCKFHILTSKSTFKLVRLKWVQFIH